MIIYIKRSLMREPHAKSKAIQYKSERELFDIQAIYVFQMIQCYWHICFGGGRKEIIESELHIVNRVFR